jgi:NAD(P)-dependent dehydrogenase (short-subunit alcohol dehydrogenase family)
MTQHPTPAPPVTVPLSGKRVVVVGASSGIGRATAQTLAQAGARLALAARRHDALVELADEIGISGGAATAISLDVRDRESVEAGLGAAVAWLGGLDLVIYATGTNLKERAIDVLPPAGWADLTETNLTGAFHVTQVALPILRAGGGGLLIYISSMGAKKPDASGVAYQASKQGLVGLAHGTMEEQRAHGIRTTVIFPGLTDTPLVLKRPVPTPPEVLARALQPEDVADACLFVASLAPRAHVPELLLYPSQP